jgi:outer membrane protein assembly factor BamD (BamD/ComL family)
MIADRLAFVLLALSFSGSNNARVDVQQRSHDTVLAEQAVDDSTAAADVDREAGRDMEIGRWYLGRRDYFAAINRFKIVTTRFQTSTHVEEALGRLAEVYLILGVRMETERIGAELDRRFPNGRWSAAVRALLKPPPRDPTADGR